MTKCKSFYAISLLGTCLIMYMFDSVLFAYFVVLYLRSKWFSKFHKSWESSPYIRLIYSKDLKFKFKYNFISTSLSLRIKMEVDFEMFAARNGKKFQKMSSLDNEKRLKEILVVPII